MKKLSLVLLILGLIFSQVILFRFNVNHGLEFHHVWIKILPIADYAGKSSPQLFLTTAFIGYIFYLIFGAININKMKAPETFKTFILFSGITIVVGFFEISSIFEDLNSKFQGKHFRIGWLIFLLGLWIFIKRYYQKAAKN